jgi:NAD(P)-dependent dehydrogenase (short-subunit alcohol dehydrogenase family)
MRFTGKVAIVTGAKHGLGLATARRLAAEGAGVVLADHNDASAEAAEMQGEARRAIAVQVDVADERQVADLFAETVKVFGRVDILVNNAAVFIPKPVPATTAEDFDLMVRVNLKGAFLCARAAVPIMKTQGGGVIVNVGSESSLVGIADGAVYAATKGALVQLTRSMAIDHASDGIRVNCVCPGPMATPMLTNVLDLAPDAAAAAQAVAAKTLLKRMGTPDEIAGVIAFVASDEASYVTGAIVAADGGWSAQ